jgi:hypothetical protein
MTPCPLVSRHPQEAHSAGIWPPGWGSGRLGRFRGADGGEYYDLPSVKERMNGSKTSSGDAA